MKKTEKAKNFLRICSSRHPERKKKHFRVHGRIQLKKYIQIWSVIWIAQILLKFIMLLYLFRNLNTATLIGDIRCDGKAKQPHPTIIIATLRYSPVWIPVIVSALQADKYFQHQTMPKKREFFVNVINLLNYSTGNIAGREHRRLTSAERKRPCYSDSNHQACIPVWLDTAQTRQDQRLDRKDWRQSNSWPKWQSPAQPATMSDLKKEN